MVTATATAVVEPNPATGPPALATRRRSARLRGTWLRDAQLRGARLRGARLRDAWFRSGRICDARFWGAWLRDAWFWGAWLCDAWFRSGRICDARFRGGRVRGVRVRFRGGCAGGGPPGGGPTCGGPPGGGPGPAAGPSPGGCRPPAGDRRGRRRHRLADLRQGRAEPRPGRRLRPACQHRGRDAGLRTVRPRALPRRAALLGRPHREQRQGGTALAHGLRADPRLGDLRGDPAARVRGPHPRGRADPEQRRRRRLLARAHDVAQPGPVRHRRVGVRGLADPGRWRRPAPDPLPGPAAGREPRAQGRRVPELRAITGRRRPRRAGRRAARSSRRPGQGPRCGG
ncbi:pentapeptide repeat-containing protein [Amorphoplanes digitatis]|uniref:pentapeptide repeat-containing protein n=1 Tax=Actinoplanes digitatis TaxID=1868 RepID=UPI0034DAED18